jgi:hypothetical protein
LAQSIYFKDPNGLSLEYCRLVGNPPEPGALRHSEFTLPRAALELTDTLTQARSARDRAKKGVSRHKFTAAISWLADHLIEAFAAYGEAITHALSTRATSSTVRSRSGIRNVSRKAENPRLSARV